jgi:hypothetical protein|tara:strand:- start:3002 stop:3550 length:549 start_codon:yes stop_codon:yes gene_type:complete
MPGEFWNNAAMEPKRSHRFLLQFDLLDQGTSQIYARKVNKPAFEVGQSEHKFLGQTYHFPGAVTWNDVSATLVNAATPDFDAVLQGLLRAGGYVSPDDVSRTGNVDNAGTLNKIDAVDALGSVLIYELDGDGRNLGFYELNNAWVKAIAYGDLDYSSEDLLTVDITFRYDWATYSKSHGSAG